MKLCLFPNKTRNSCNGVGSIENDLTGFATKTYTLFGFISRESSTADFLSVKFHTLLLNKHADWWFATKNICIFSQIIQTWRADIHHVDSTKNRSRHISNVAIENQNILRTFRRKYIYRLMSLSIFYFSIRFNKRAFSETGCARIDWNFIIIYAGLRKIEKCHRIAFNIVKIGITNMGK